VRIHGLLWRGRVGAFAAVFGCSSLAELTSHLGNRVLYDHRESIGRIVLPETFEFPSENDRLYESNLRQLHKLSNRRLIEENGLRISPFRPIMPVHAFVTVPGESFWSGSPDLRRDGKPDSDRDGELFPDRVVIFAPGEAALLVEARRRNNVC
jgi:hypothetical protein